MQAWFVRDEWQVHRRHSDFGGRHRFVQIKKGLVLVQRFFSGQLEDVRLWWFVLFSLLKESRAVYPMSRWFVMRFLRIFLQAPQNTRLFNSVAAIDEPLSSRFKPTQVFLVP